MKSKLFTLVALLTLGLAQQSQAETKAPKGCHFEVQVKYLTAHQHHGVVRTFRYWETYKEFEYLSDAEDLYDLLAEADANDKLPEILGMPRSSRKYPIAVRLLFVCQGKVPFLDDELLVIDTTDTSR